MIKISDCFPAAAMSYLLTSSTLYSTTKALLGRVRSSALSTSQSSNKISYQPHSISGYASATISFVILNLDSRSLSLQDRQSLPQEDEDLERLMNMDSRRIPFIASLPPLTKLKFLLLYELWFYLVDRHYPRRMIQSHTFCGSLDQSF